MKQFWEVRVGQKFFFNGNEYTKRTSRTAFLHRYERIFYLNQYDICRIV